MSGAFANARCRLFCLGIASLACACDGPLLHLGDNVTVLVAIGAPVGADSGTSIDGKLHEALCTSFQPANWQYAFFANNKPLSAQRPTDLANLAPQRTRVRVQLMDGGAIPWRSSAPDVWDFTKLDAVMNELLQVADVELQIADPPPFVGTGAQIDRDLFRQYAANLVAYYNRDSGFSAGSVPFASPVRRHITWWSVLSDPNAQLMSGADYAALLADVVSAMRDVDPAIRVSAPELTLSGRLHSPSSFQWFKDFAAASSGLKIDAISLHLYGTASQGDPDALIFDPVPGYAKKVRDISQFASSYFPGVPVRVTQNNVNADAPVYDSEDEKWVSTNDRSYAFTADERGTNAFFAAYRSYLFSQLGKVGNRSLCHWLYTGGHCEPGSVDYCDPSLGSLLDTDVQNAEVNYLTGERYLSYWVDYWLGRMFPADDGDPGADILDASSLDPETLEPMDAEVEVLAVRRPDDSVVVMLVDHAAVDDKGKSMGVPRTILVDVSKLSRFSRASLLVLDSKVDLLSLPMQGPTPIPLEGRITVPLSGYGVAFLVLS